MASEAFEERMEFINSKIETKKDKGKKQKDKQEEDLDQCQVQ